MEVRITAEERKPSIKASIREEQRDKLEWKKRELAKVEDTVPRALHRFYK